MGRNATALARFGFLFVALTASGYATAETISLEQVHGIYMVPVRINDAITLPFVIDSGASEVAIPSDVLLTLSRSGSIGPNDALGAGTYKLADGSIQKSERFLLHEVRIGNKVIKDVVANVAPVAGDPLLGQSFLSKLPIWTLDNSQHALILGDESLPKTQDMTNATGYKLFVEDGWLFASKNLFTESGQLIMRRYGYEQNAGSFLNVLLFFCPKMPNQFSVLDIVIPKNYVIKSFRRTSENSALPVRILTDNTSTWHFEADYKNGEMFIDRTPTNYGGFDAVMNARELLIGFGTGDSLHYYLTPKMDTFMKEASAAVGSGAAELGDITFLDRQAASERCHGYQTSRHIPKGEERSNTIDRYWVVRGTVSCPGCDPTKGKTSMDVEIFKEQNGHITSQGECMKVLDTYRTALVQAAKREKLVISLRCVKEGEP